MKCPHCGIAFHETWSSNQIVLGNQLVRYVRVVRCPECAKITYELGHPVPGAGFSWRRVEPRGIARSPVPAEVPAHIASDYTEACEVLPISPKASAALARRCLQAILHGHGYKARTLVQEIDALLNEPDPTKSIPTGLRDTIDAIRNFGNFSAHPMTDVTSLQIIDVDPEEAEWCLETLEAMFDHFYVQPARATARKNALNQKLAAAGKPAAK